MPSPERSPYMVATSPPIFLYVAITVTQGNINGDSTDSQGNQEVAESENVSTTPVEPYCNMPPISHIVIQGDDEGSGSGDEKSQTEGVYRAYGISGEIEEHQIFRLKKELMTSLSIISMRDKL